MATGHEFLMNILPIRPVDLQRVDKLYQEWGYPEDCTRIASDTGIMCVGDKIYGAVFFYKTNSPMAWVELMVVKKGLEKEQKNVVFDMLVEGLDRLANDNGYKIVAANPIYQKTCQRIEKHGYKHVQHGIYWKEF